MPKQICEKCGTPLQMDIKTLNEEDWFCPKCNDWRITEPLGPLIDSRKKMEPIMLDFLIKEGVIQEREHISFEWTNITSRTIEVDIEVLMTAILEQAKAISELNDEKLSLLNDIISDLETAKLHEESYLDDLIKTYKKIKEEL